MQIPERSRLSYQENQWVLHICIKFLNAFNLISYKHKMIPVSYIVQLRSRELIYTRQFFFLFSKGQGKNIAHRFAQLPSRIIPITVNRKVT